MALQYPSFSQPQPIDLTLLDVARSWQGGVDRGRQQRYSDDGNLALERLAQVYGQPDPMETVLRANGALHLRSEIGMNDRLARSKSADAGAMPGLDGYMGAVAARESGGNPDARNPRSSATGAYQITDGTWSGLMRNNPDLGLTPDGRTDPGQSDKAMRALTAENAAALRAAGVPLTPGSLYAAHFLGAGAAPSVLTAAADTPMRDLVSPQVLSANPHLSGMTAGDFTAWARRVGTNDRGGFSAPQPGADGGFPMPMGRQVPMPDKQLLTQLLRNPTTRDIGLSLIAQRQKADTVDQFQSFKGPDGAIYQMNLATGETSLLRDPAKQAANAPQVETVFDPTTGLERKMVWNAQTGQWDDFGGTKAPAAKPDFNASQATAAGYADRMAQADAILSKPDLATVQTDVVQKSMAGIPGVGNMLTSAEFQQADQAQRDFINAILRRESGAVISQSEFDNARRQYFPQLGDSKQVLRQKAANRRNAINGVARAAGPAYVAPDTSNYLTNGNGDASQQGGDVAQPQTQAEFDALPSGSLYVDPEDGQTYRKD